MRYYSTQRPVQPGGYPDRTSSPDIIHNFDTRKFCEEIGREAWGYLEYPEPLSEQDVSAYELVPAGRKYYWCVTTAIDDRGKVISAITNVQEFDEKPENNSCSTSRKDIYNDWFDTEEEANAFVESSKKA